MGMRHADGMRVVMTADPQVLQRHEAHHDQERAPEHLSAALDVRRNRPANEHDEGRAHAEQKRVTGGEAHRDSERPGPAGSRRPIAQIAVHRQRRDRHQVIGAKTVQEAQEKGGRQKEQSSVIIPNGERQTVNC